MKKLTVVVGLIAAMGVAFAAPDEAKLRASMKQIGPVCSGLGKKLKAKDASGAADAKQLAGLFGDTQKYFKEAKADDGVAHSKTAIAEFKTTSKLIAAGKWDEADAGFKKATASCSGCHSKHREKASDGSWKVK
ncbi:MAG: hypothetical protein IT168_00330 [Bryobacterales bacterium]|nr:hypothetical protein [Bryobacterales bacterium]